MGILLRREMFASLVAVQVMFAFGAVLGYTAYLLPELRAEKSGQFNIDQRSFSIIAISGVCLLPLGTIINIYIVEKIGRKGTMLVIMLVSSIGWLITALAPNVFVLVAGRMINSLMMGLSPACDVYISEVCSNEHRGTFAAFFSPLMSLGGAIIYVLVYTLEWRLAALIMALYSMAILMLMRMIPESKHWYATTNRIQEAKASIKWFNDCSEEDVARELSEILKSIPSATSFRVKWNTFLQPNMLKRFAAISILHVCSQWTGVMIIIGFAVDYFTSLGIPYDEEILALISGFLSFISSSALATVIHTCNRRTFLICSGIGMVVSMSMVLMYRICELKIPAFPVTCLFLYIICYGLGISDVVWIIMPELFPTVLRGAITSAISIFSFGNMSVSLYLYWPIIQHLGFDWLCAIFTLSSLGVVLVTIFFIPETRNIPLHLIGIDGKINLS